VLFHPKQLTVLSGGDDAEVRVWDLVDKSCIAVLKVCPIQWLDGFVTG
jgi:WD40 repeat protein